MSDNYIFIESLNKTIYWPYCKRGGCKNRRCLALNSVYCYPHTEKEKNVDKQELMEQKQ